MRKSLLFNRLCDRTVRQYRLQHLLPSGMEGCAPLERLRSRLSRRATVPSVALEPAASSLLLRLTQARIGDTLYDGNVTRVTVVNAFATVNPATEAIVRAVDYQVVGAPGQFRLFADDAGDVARWRRVEGAAS